MPEIKSHFPLDTQKQMLLVMAEIQIVMTHLMGIMRAVQVELVADMVIMERILLLVATAKALHFFALLVQTQIQLERLAVRQAKQLN
jgi:hypothetical protein